MTRSDVGDKEKMITSIQILTSLGPVTYFLGEGLSKDRKAHKRNFKKGLPAPHKSRNALRKNSFSTQNEIQVDSIMDSELTILDYMNNFDLEDNF